MANYYRLVNVTKMEIFEPGYVTRSCYTRKSAEIVERLLEDWCGDEVRMLGDWADEDSLMGLLYEESRSWTNRANLKRG